MLIDFEKAFDSVAWPFLMEVLQKSGIGPQFLRYVGLLYHQPMAQVRVNGVLSASFPIRRGTRQGCPLSPLPSPFRPSNRTTGGMGPL